MQKLEQYRLFAETLTAAAQEAQPDTRDLLLRTAEAWTALADSEEISLQGGDTVVDFAQARLRMRST